MNTKTPHRASLRRRWICGTVAFYFIVGGLIVAAAMAQRITVPVRPAVVALFSSLIIGLLAMNTSRVSVLSRLMIIVYTAPFAGTIAYLYDPDFHWWSTERAIELLSDPLTVRFMMTIGLIGLLGLMTGLLFSSIAAPPRPRPDGPRRVLPLWCSIALTILATFLSYIRAPPKSLFAVAYATVGNTAIADKLNFNSAFLISYLLLVLLVIDVERDVKGTPRRRYKMAFLAVACTYIVIWLQLMRGDRESIGLIAALLALSATRDPGKVNERLKRVLAAAKMRKLVIVALLVVVSFTLLGYLRYSFGATADRTRDIGHALKTTLLQDNTWTGVLLTNLGQAHEHRHGSGRFLAGQTYLEYLQSLPPGIITRAFGIVRPIESNKGPEWWYVPLSGGGVHAAVVPYENFGPFGLFAILAFFGWCLGRIEALDEARPPGWTRLFFATCVLMSFHWFWYGDMNGIRGVMIASLLWIMYISLLAIFAPRRSRRPVAASPEGVLAYRH